MLTSNYSFVLCFFQAEDGIRDLVRSRGLGDVYKRQLLVKFMIFLVIRLSKLIYLMIEEYIFVNLL